MRGFDRLCDGRWIGGRGRGSGSPFPHFPQLLETAGTTASWPRGVEASSFIDLLRGCVSQHVQREPHALLTLRGLIRTLLPARSAERGPGGRVDRRCAATGNARHPLSRNETDDLLYVRPSPARTVSARKADDFAKGLSSLGVMSSGEEAYLRVLATLATARFPFDCRRVPRWAGSTARRRQ